MITGGDLRQSRLDVGYKTFTISPWSDSPSNLAGGQACMKSRACSMRIKKSETQQ